MSQDKYIDPDRDCLWCGEPLGEPEYRLLHPECADKIDEKHRAQGQCDHDWEPSTSTWVLPGQRQCKTCGLVEFEEKD